MFEGPLILVMPITGLDIDLAKLKDEAAPYQIQAVAPLESSLLLVFYLSNIRLIKV